MKISESSKKILVFGLLIGIFLLSVYGRVVQRFFLQGSFAAVLIEGALVIAGVVSASLLLPRVICVNRAWLLASFLSSVAFYSMTEVPEEWVHLLEYAGLVLAVRAAWPEKSQVLVCIAVIAVSVIDETVQSISPGRIFDPKDLILNVFAVLCGISVHNAVLASVHFRFKNLS